ncbi:MAG: hypothetical protein R3277_01325 [Brumimicrobium sp.]|nr:hypothetical protein [Brumimicrobium sp.]
MYRVLGIFYNILYVFNSYYSTVITQKNTFKGFSNPQAQENFNEMTQTFTFIGLLFYIIPVAYLIINLVIAVKPTTQELFKAKTKTAV